MDSRVLGRTHIAVSPIGFGAFKLGRNENIKYPQGYDLPDERAAERILNSLVDMGVRYIDTAPAYGISEERIGRYLSHRRDEFTLSTKVGETFDQGTSHYDYSSDSVNASLARSLKRLQTDVVDCVFVHSNGEDLEIQNNSDVVGALQKFKEQGGTQAIGFSGKTIEGTRAALRWADVIMVEYHVQETSFAEVIDEAAAARIGVVVKKGFASGHLPPEEAIQFVLSNPHVSSLVVGTLNAQHMQSNLSIAEAVPQFRSAG